MKFYNIKVKQLNRKIHKHIPINKNNQQLKIQINCVIKKKVKKLKKTMKF